MANKNIIEILINAKNNASQAFRQAGTDAKGLSSALGFLKTAAISLGLLSAGKEAFDFAVDARKAAIEAENAKNKLTLAAGGAQEYEATIKAAKEATRGMVSETALANGAFVLLEMNLASNAQEAAKLANAGQILSKAFESQGASVELFNRLLANGSAVLLDNFGISQAQVKVRTEQIEAATGLAEAEARLQAIRELAIDKSERLASTLSDETVAAEQNKAAYEDMTVALGNFVKQAEASANATGLMTDIYEGVTAGANGWAIALDAVSKRNQLAAMAAERLGRELTFNEASMIATGNVSGELADVLDDIIAETRELEETQRRATGTLDSYRQMQELTAAQMEAQMGRALDAQTARWQGLANAQRTASGGEQLLETMAGGSTFNAQEAADFEAAQKEKEQAAKQTASVMLDAFDSAANEIANSISGAVGSAFGRLQEVMPDIFGDSGADQEGEFARRLAALRDGVQDSDLGFLDAFKAQAGGSPLFAALLQSLEEGDQAGVASEANRLLQENMAQVLAVGLAESIKQKMAQEDIMAEAQQIVADQLGQVEKKVVNISTAAGAMKTETKGATDQIVTSTTKVIELTKEWDRILGGISGKYENIAKNANALNPAAQTGAGPTNATNEQMNR